MSTISRLRPLALSTVFSFLAIVSSVGPGAAEDANFYQGKTVNVIVGFGPGGGYDLYARLLAPYLTKHIPGHPNVVVQNLVGAGGVRAANSVYAVAPKDGTTIAAVNQGAGMFQMLGGKGAQYDINKVQWLGSLAHSNNVAYVWSASGVKTLDDTKTREVPLAGSGVISDANIYPAVFNAILGTRFKVINGYEGTNDSNLAIERGEVAGRGGGAYSSLVSTRPQWLSEKKINILVQVGFEKEPDLPDVPLLVDLAKTKEDKQIATIVTLPTAIGYNFWLAPEVPAERLSILRAAYNKAIADPALLADAKKINLEIRPKTGEEVAAMVKKAADTPPDVLAKTAKILGW